MRHLVRALALAGVIAVVSSAGVSLASGSSVHLRVPKHAKLDAYYSIGLHGFAVGTERLYLFLDYHTCGPNPAVEHARANGDTWKVHGAFREVARKWKSSLKGVDHACAYLQRKSKRRNSAGGIIARATKAYRIH